LLDLERCVLVRPALELPHEGVSVPEHRVDEGMLKVLLGYQPTQRTRGPAQAVRQSRRRLTKGRDPHHRLVTEPGRMSFEAFQLLLTLTPLLVGTRLLGHQLASSFLSASSFCRWAVSREKRDFFF